MGPKSATISSSRRRPPVGRDVGENDGVPDGLTVGEMDGRELGVALGLDVGEAVRHRLTS